MWFPSLSINSNPVSVPIYRRLSFIQVVLTVRPSVSDIRLTSMKILSLIFITPFLVEVNHRFPS